jgi:DNA mismatch repair ATPase MutS
MPSDADKARWADLAKKAKTPLSPWVIEIVESTLAENEEFQPRREIVKELESLRNETRTLREELRQKEIVLERYESELKHFRSQAFLEEDYQGVRRYSKEIVDIFKARGQIDSYRLLEDLGIDPRESDLVKGVSKQLEELEGYGMIKPTSKGWKWTG